jgi:hypothetical protein
MQAQALNIPKTARFHDYVTDGWVIAFPGQDNLVTVTATANPNGTVTYRIDRLINWFCTNVVEVEAILQDYADKGNWEQEK